MDLQEFSPSSQYITPSSQYICFLTGGCRIVIRSSETLDVVHTFVCVDKVNHIEWSPDSAYILCAMFSRAAVQAFSMEDPEWKCRINEGVAGLIYSSWLPDSKAIITESDFGIQLGIWSLSDSNCSVILSPKFISSSISNISSRSFSFSKCGNYMGVIHRIDLQDHIGIYLLNPLEELSKFKCRSNDVSSICWTYAGNQIVAIDSALSYRAIIYSPAGEVSYCR